MSTYTGCLEDITWRYCNTLFRAGTQPACCITWSLWIWVWRSVGLVPCCQPSSSASNPYFCPAPGFMERDNKCKCPSESLGSFVSLLSEGLKKFNGKIHSETQHVGTCKFNNVQPEYLPSRSWSVLRRLLGCPVNVPCSAYAGQMQLGSQWHSWPPHTDHSVHELGGT